MFISELLKKRKFDLTADRIGPDIPFTHWRLYFKSTMQKLCKQKFAQFADEAEIRPGVYVICCSKVRLGKKVVIRPGSMIFACPDPTPAIHVTIEDYVLLGSGIHIYTNNHNYQNTNIPIYDQNCAAVKPVTIKKGSWLGANVILLPGVTIGENSVIAAGSVVTKDIPPRVVAGGVPAKVLKQISNKKDTSNA